MRKCLSFIVLFFLLANVVAAADSADVRISISKQRINDKQVEIIIKAVVAKNIQLYGLKQTEDDALYSTIDFDSAAGKLLAGKIVEAGSVHSEKDATTNTTVNYFLDSVIWKQTIAAATTDSFSLKAVVNYLYKKGDEYLSGEENLKLFINPETASSTGSITASTDASTQSLWWIFISAFAGGLLALLTPCVYSMIPITVSFFTKRSKTKSEGIRNALLYSASIIVIFTLLGFLITLIFGPAALNNLATNWIANLIFFAVFLLFGISFLGAFEIALPSSLSTKTDSKAGMSSITGIFFMALTLVVVSFSCTGPIIGNLLVLAAKGNYYGPLIGMFGFSTALALPFALFAFFPSKLNMLGKPGGWLNAVKVTLGFLELALALKFLSNADLSRGWRLLDREIFIVLWVVIFLLLGIYLLGKIKFKHDDDLPKNDYGHPYLSVTRLMFAITTFAFAVYMIPGLWGAPLKSISAFLPPMGTQNFNITNVPAASHTPNDTTTTVTLAHPEKYYEQMRIYEPDVVVKYGLVTYFDYNEALDAARKHKKPLMLDFTGINCVNCRKMEGQVWSDAAVMKRLKENFVIVSLYVDVQNVEIPQSEQYFSKLLDRQVETLGDKNADMQVTTFGANTQPFYFFLDANETKLAEEGYGYDSNVDKFIKLLDAVKAKYDAGS